MKENSLIYDEYDGVYRSLCRALKENYDITAEIVIQVVHLEPFYFGIQIVRENLNKAFKIACLIYLQLERQVLQKRGEDQGSYAVCCIYESSYTLYQ